MKIRFPICVLLLLTLAHVSYAQQIDGWFYETAKGRTQLPKEFAPQLLRFVSPWTNTYEMPDGRTVTLRITRSGNNFELSIKAQPDSDILKWGFAVASKKDEYYTGLMERVVDGPQRASWAPGLKAAMDLRGQKVEMIIKPTTSVYAPFYLSSAGYALLIKSNWPGLFDFAATNPDRVLIEFEGPSLDLKVYTAKHPAELVRAHALDAGPPFLPPKWMFKPWRWRDEHTQRATYYDGTPVTGPFNSEIMEDVLLMRRLAFRTVFTGSIVHGAPANRGVTMISRSTINDCRILRRWCAGSTANSRRRCSGSHHSSRAR